MLSIHWERCTRRKKAVRQSEYVVLRKVFNVFSGCKKPCVFVVFKAVFAPRAPRLYVAGTMDPMFSWCFKQLSLHALAVVWGGDRGCAVFHKVFNRFCQGSDWVAPKWSVETVFLSFPHSR